ncbi:hypothetical protein SAMN05444166_6149 [Singulisphaera sp. GP187]|nr:hypothetical protein SAMN05444166_6149 [Singulisphaera sp. GP187]
MLSPRYRVFCPVSGDPDPRERFTNEWRTLGIEVGRIVDPALVFPRKSQPGRPSHRLNHEAQPVA